ncbi:MAG: carbamoyl phosphate synthase small subunit [Erysipelothrix sp.]
MERYLILEDGTVFRGKAFGHQMEVTGTLKIYTGAQGYQEVMTSPNNQDNIVIYTYPSVGNSGINIEDNQSLQGGCLGIIVRHYSINPSHWRSKKSLEEVMLLNKIPGITDIDTRMLVRYIRKNNIKTAIISDTLEPSKSYDSKPNHIHINGTYQVQGRGPRVTILDLGVNQTLIQNLMNQQCHISVLPYTSSIETIAATYPDGILLSNGSLVNEIHDNHIEAIKSNFNSIPIIGLGLGAHLLLGVLPENKMFDSSQTTTMKPQLVKSLYGGFKVLDEHVLALEKDLNTDVTLAYKYSYQPIYGYDYEESDPRTESIIQTFIENMKQEKEQY